MARANICLNCADNRAMDDDELCAMCRTDAVMIGYRGDGL